MATPTDLSPQAMLTLARWFSPAFPTGSYAYSHGLEWAVHAGDVNDAETLRNWITGILDHGSGRNDAILLAAAWRTDDPTEADTIARALCTSAERLRETSEQGAAFAKAAGLPSPLTLPVAIGQAARRENLPLLPTLQHHLFSFAATLVSAALRLMPLGQTAGQSLLAALQPLCLRIAAEAATATPDDIGTCAFLADIASMQHETLEPRIFRT